MSTSVDVTSEVKTGSVDNEFTYITRCKCGQGFNAWDFMISIYEDDTRECFKCGAKFWFRSTVTVYQVVEK